MKVLMILTNPFTHDPRVYNEAKSLLKAGHKVTVYSWDNKKLNPENEIIDSIRVIRSFNSWFMNILPFDLMKLHLWWRKAYKELLKLFKNEKFDVVHCHDFDTLPIGVKLKKKLGVPLIYDSHEFFAYGMSRKVPFWKYYFSKEKKLLNYVDRIITVNQPLKDFFQKITKKPVSIIMNAKPLQEKKYTKPENEIFTLFYAGTIAKPRFLLELVDVVNDLEEVKCVIAGDGVDREYLNSLEAKSSETDKVDFLGKVTMDNVVTLTKKSDIVICMTDPNDPNNSRATANKQFEAMVCGRPIICTKETYPGKFTEQKKVGIIAEYTKKDLKRAILELKNNPGICEEYGKNALNSAIGEYNWEKQEEKLVEIYENII